MNKLLINPPLKVFLCHAHADRHAVRGLYARLKRDRFAPWLDQEALLPGQNWVREIHKAILKSDVVIVCLSKAFNEKHGFRHEELKVALKKAKVLPMDNIFIIPLRLEECDLPESLRHLHRVDLFEKGGYPKLLRALRRREPL
jgi:hypothetical protein